MPRLHAYWLTIVIALAGCAKPVASPEPVTAPVPVAAPIASAAPAVPAVSTTVVFIDKAGIRLAEPRTLVPLASDASRGADARYKRSGPNDLYLVPLAEALTEEKAKGRLTVPLPVVVDESTAYRVLVEVLFTAGQLEIGDYTVYENALGGRSFPFHAPRVSSELGGGEPPRERLNLTVLIVSEGLAVKTGMGNLAPGCNGTGPGLTIPRSNARLDLEVLTSCVGKVRSAKPDLASERDALLVANPGIPFRELMDVALTVAGPSQELFPTIALGVPR